MPSKIAKQKQTCGAAKYAKTNPSEGAINSATKIVNIIISFEEALKLNLAIDECVRRLNSYNRATVDGRRSALNIALHLNKQRITVQECML
jgi:hypothetical protein